jgi:hypothetical protein
LGGREGERVTILVVGGRHCLQLLLFLYRSVISIFIGAT